MAMSKREQLELDTLRQRVAELEALRITTPPPTRDLPRPAPDSPFGTTTFGWNFNSYTKRVYPVSSESHAHCDGKHVNRSSTRDYHSGWSQYGVDLYSTPQRAYLALRAAVEAEYAKVLAEIDAAMAELEEMEKMEKTAEDEMRGR